MPRHAARWVFTGEDLLQNHVVVTDDAGHISAITPAGQPIPDGLLMPGLVNAHTHLELSGMAGRVPGGDGGVPWVQALLALRAQVSAEDQLQARDAAAAGAHDMGTAFVIDVSNAGDTAPAMRAAGLRGVVQVEAIGLAESRWRPRLHALALDDNSVVHRPTAHSPISCSPALLAAVLAPGDGPAATVHCDEDPADALLLAHRAGPWVGFHQAVAAMVPGHDWQQALPRGRSGVAVLHALGLLGPHLGLVHLVTASAEDLDLVAQSGATAVLCPRSNLHIGGAVPDVASMVARGIPFAMGTDSLASAPDLDLVAEGAALIAHVADLSPLVVARAMTAGGGALVRDPDAGRLSLGTRPGLLRIDLPGCDHPLATLLDGTRWPRRWCA